MWGAFRPDEVASRRDEIQGWLHSDHMLDLLETWIIDSLGLDEED